MLKIKDFKVEKKTLEIKSFRLSHAQFIKVLKYGLFTLILMGAISFLLNVGLDFTSFYSIAKNPIVFSLLNFVGHIFFVFLPGEEIMFLYFISGPTNLLLAFLLAVFTAMAAQIIDYLMGYFVSTNIIDAFIKPQHYKSAESYVHRYGGWMIFLFNLLPLSSPIILLAAGMLKYDFKKAMLWSVFGLSVKYIGLIFIGDWLF